MKITAVTNIVPPRSRKPLEYFEMGTKKYRLAKVKVAIVGDKSKYKILPKATTREDQEFLKTIHPTSRIPMEVWLEMVKKMNDLQVLHLAEQGVAIPKDRIKAALKSKTILVEEPGEGEILVKKVYHDEVLNEDILYWVPEKYPIIRVLPGGLGMEEWYF